MKDPQKVRKESSGKEKYRGTVSPLLKSNGPDPFETLKIDKEGKIRRPANVIPVEGWSKKIVLSGGRTEDLR